MSPVEDDINLLFAAAGYRGRGGELLRGRIMCSVPPRNVRDLTRADKSVYAAPA